MKGTRRHDYHDRIIDEAADWFVRLQDTDVSTEDREAFSDWLSASSEHVREYLALANMHAEIAEASGTVNSNELIDVARAASPQNVIPLREPVAASSRGFALAAQSSIPRVARRRSRVWGIALLALVFVLWWHPDDNAAPYVTGIGEQKSFPLADGSVITLNAVSSVQVHFNNHFRDVQLLSGEALFTVAKNPNRPFRVLINDGVIQAVGTQFNVYHRGDGTTVTVVEGTVRVSGGLSAANAVNWVPVKAGQRAHVGAKTAPIIVNDTDPAVDTSWRERRLVFQARPLSEVVAEFNLYNATALVISDPRLAQVRVSGSFYTNDPRSFALFLQEAKLAKQQDESGRIVLLAPF